MSRDAYVTPHSLAEKTRAWLEQVSPFNRLDLTLNKDRSALLVVDMQGYFLDPSAGAYTEGGPAILPNVKSLLQAFRAARRPVIFTRHVHHPGLIDAGIMAWWWDGMCLEGSPESEIDPELAPLPGEKVIFKHRYSAFYNTDLETILRVLRVEDLVITGVMTNMCCETTARDAYQRDYRVFFPADASGSTTEDFHLASLLNLSYGFAQITTTASILGQITGSTAGQENS
jgi:nicotinamidase-related amidase